MYCQKCGIHNTDDAKQCQVCGVEITGEEKQENVKIFTDLTWYPFQGILYSLKNVNPLLAIIVVPLITLFYFFKKMTGKPFFSHILNSRTPKYHKTDVEQFSRLHKKSFEQASSYFFQQGFEPLIDLEDVSTVQGYLQKLLCNRTQKIYGIIHINKVTGKVTHVTLFAITSNNTYISIDNAYAASLQLPKNLIVKHFPKQSIEKIHQELLHTLKELQEEPRLLALEYIQPIGYQVRCFSIEQGLRQGLFHTKGKETPAATVCYHHPSNIAVRTCSVCHTALCEACYTPYQDQYYCANCLPEEARSTMFSQIPTGEKYAGLGVRTLATLIDLSILAVAVVAVYVGLLYGIRTFITKEASLSIPLLVAQLFGVIFTVLYWILPLRKYGKTIGKKILGLRVVDRHGKIPDSVAAIVRFAYVLFSCLFFFPLLGYLFIPFRKNKQGLHDQLAGTYVVTKHPVRKAVLSWSMLLIMAGAGAWFVYHWLLPWFPFFRSFSPADVVAEVTLEPKWRYEFSDDRTHMLPQLTYADHCIIATSSSLQALNMRTGESVWTIDNLPNIMLQPFSEGAGAPLVLHQYHEDGDASLLHVAPESGTLLWKENIGGDGRVALDAQSIVVYSEDMLSEYDLQGRLLWRNENLKERFQDNLVVEYVRLNGGILVGRYSEQSQALAYFARQTGELIWEDRQNDYYPGYSIGEGYQILHTSKGKTLLMYLPEQKLIWESPLDIGHVMAREKISSNGESNLSSADLTRFYLYTTTEVVRGDGSLVFSYPSDAYFNAVTEDFLVLRLDSEILKDGFKTEILLVDKLTGEVHKSFQEKAWFVVGYLTEDDSHIYLGANIKPDSKSIGMSSELLIINKHTLELREIPVGKNIHSLQFTVFPQENLVFIPTYQHVGGYKIPMKNEK